MDDGGDVMRLENAIKEFRIKDASRFDRHRSLSDLRQAVRDTFGRVAEVIDNDDIIASLNQRDICVGPDVSGTAG